LNEELKPIQEHCPELSPDIVGVIGRALEKEPDDRYHEMAEVLADLQGEQRDISSTIQSAGKVKKAKISQRGIVLAGAVAVLALIAVFLIHRLQMESVPIMPVTHKQITFAGNVSISPTFDDLSPLSPDGQFLAYSLPKDSSHSVMVQDLSGGQPIEVYRGIESLFCLRWSPDGSRLLLSIIPNAETGSGRHDLIIIPRLGGKAQTLPFWGYTTWSPDGTQIAATLQPLKSITFYNTTTGDSTHIIRLHDFQWFYDFDWAPVGDRIVFLASVEQQ